MQGTNIEDYFRVLGIQVGASPEEIKQAYRDLAIVWHPDRFVDDPKMQAKAHTRMQEINSAFEKIQEFLKHLDQYQQASMSGKGIHAEAHGTRPDGAGQSDSQAKAGSEECRNALRKPQGHQAALTEQEKTVKWFSWKSFLIAIILTLGIPGILGMQEGPRKGGKPRPVQHGRSRPANDPGDLYASRQARTAPEEVRVPEPQTLAMGDLVWSADANLNGKPLNWASANDFINRMNKDNFAGYSDWRLPTAAELKSLARHVNGSSAGVRNIQKTYLSSTVSPSYNFTTAGVEMSDGHIWWIDKTSTSLYVWPVRSGL